MDFTRLFSRRESASLKEMAMLLTERDPSQILISTPVLVNGDINSLLAGIEITRNSGVTTCTSRSIVLSTNQVLARPDFTIGLVFVCRAAESLDNQSGLVVYGNPNRGYNCRMTPPSVFSRSQK